MHKVIDMSPTYILLTLKSVGVQNNKVIDINMRLFLAGSLYHPLNVFQMKSHAAGKHPSVKNVFIQSLNHRA